MKIFTLLLTLMLVCSCSATKPAPQTPNPLDMDSWENSRSIMRAGEHSGNLELAIATGLRELEKRPENDEARVALAKLQTRAGRPDQALYTLEHLHGSSSTDSEIESARAYLASGRLAAADDILQRLSGSAALDEHNARSINKLRAISEDLKGNHDAAQRIYAQLLTEKEEGSVRFNYGRSLMSSGKYRQVISVLTPLMDAQEFPQARIVAAAAMANINDHAGARNLLADYLSDEEIDRLLEKTQ